MRTDLWEPPLKIDSPKFCETRWPWKLPNWIFVLNSESWSGSQSGNFFEKRKKNWGGSQKNLPQKPELTIFTKKWEPPNPGTYPIKTRFYQTNKSGKNPKSFCWVVSTYYRYWICRLFIRVSTSKCSVYWIQQETLNLNQKWYFHSRRWS